MSLVGEWYGEETDLIYGVQITVKSPLEKSKLTLWTAQQEHGNAAMARLKYVCMYICMYVCVVVPHLFSAVFHLSRLYESRCYTRHNHNSAIMLCLFREKIARLLSVKTRFEKHHE